jgi:hypothetical protein
LEDILYAKYECTQVPWKKPEILLKVMNQVSTNNAISKVIETRHFMILRHALMLLTTYNEMFYTAGNRKLSVFAF